MRNLYSYLFVPATKARSFFERLCRKESEIIIPYAVIFDIEDSIYEFYKKEARTLLSAIVDDYHHEFKDSFKWFVRINDCSTPYFAEDLDWLTRLKNQPFGIKLPKCRTLDDIKAVGGFHSAEHEVIPTIETLEGYRNRESIMHHAHQVGIRNVGFGAGDMSLELGIERDYSLPVFQHVICELIVAAKSHGLNIIDSTSRILPQENTDWETALTREAIFSRANGFSAKKSIHPAQIKIIESAFSRNDEKTASARVLEDFDPQKPTRAVRSSITGNYLGNPSIKQADKVLIESQSK